MTVAGHPTYRFPELSPCADSKFRSCFITRICVRFDVSRKWACRLKHSLYSYEVLNIRDVWFFLIKNHDDIRWSLHTDSENALVAAGNFGEMVKDLETILFG
jgi:hypothetical protein